MFDLINIIPNQGLSKKVIANQSENVIQRIKDGDLDPIKAMIAAKAMEEVVKAVLSYTRDTAIGKAEEYKGQSIYGATLQVRNTGATYDYEADQEYSLYKAQLKAREELLKEAIKSRSGKALTEDGEVVKAPPIKSIGGQTIAISFKKD